METSMILDEISLITTELAHNYPEIFRTLEEETFLSGYDSSRAITENDLGVYLDSLKKMLVNYKINHQDTLMIYQNKNLPAKLIRGSVIPS